MQRSLLIVPLVLLCLAGCARVVSLHPLVLPNDENAIFEPALVGVWEQVVKPDKAPGTRYTVTRAESGYDVAIDADQKGTMHLFRKDGWYLLDVHVPSSGVPPAAHLFLRLRLEKDTAYVAEIDQRRLVEHLKARGGIGYEVLPEDDDRIVLTSSSSELRFQLLPYLADDRAFGGETRFKRIQ